ncbi:NfeD family protein [Longispora albida]|uniref:NfeD family protein n=1 Tax=Longispora albida TaxID=203523 RepID=UPI000687F3A5|nr:NfeD family protein [Longispora albida]
MTFVLLMFGFGALLAAGAAALGAPEWAQLLVFGAGSGLSLMLLRPVLRRHRLARSGSIPVGIEAIEGSEALVLETVDGRRGMIKIGGEIWTARAYDATQIIEPGERVQVMKVDGATALVWRD